MLLFSETIDSFTKHLTSLVKQILIDEVGVNVFKKRFSYNKHYIPFQIVAFEHKSTLGFFDSHCYQIGINKTLMYSADVQTISNILRHEIGHLFTYLKHGNTVSAHGHEYHSVCRSFGWNKEIYEAKTNIKLDITQETNETKIISKVQKLLALASSSNQFEAEQATIKANQMLLKHNLDLVKEKHSKDIPTTYVKRTLHGKRCAQKHKAIYQILKHFFVTPIFNYGSNGFYLEVIGEKTNIILADYIASFLDHELENLWKHARMNNFKMKGTNAKNNFMKGIAKGYSQKINSIHQQIEKKSLICLNNSLEQHFKRAYPRTGNLKSSKSNFCKDSHNLGQKMGKNLSINPAINNKSNRKLLLN